MRSCALVLALALAGCPKSAPGPTPPAPPADAAVVVADAPGGPLDEDLPRLATRAVLLYEDVVRVFARSGVDCVAATSKLRALQPSYADVAAANAKVLHEGRAKELRAALEPHAEKLDAAAKSIAGSDTMAKCSADPAFTDAFDELVGAP